jgi:hypothetical protein
VDERTKKRRVSSDFSNSDSRVEPAVVNIPQDMSAQAAAASGSGMAGTNPQMFAWLTSGLNRNQTGMPKVDFAGLVGKEYTE